ncbi:MAG: diacylglycerol kinase family lipid kinase [Butyrivibrio sp.]|nr:diacylglycerol kinase family lipid kinase [Butyrivibrio sp.]
MYYCIVNPSARSGKGKEIWKKLEKSFKDRGLEFRAAFTKGPGHATELAHQITSAEREPSDIPLKIVVLGGDGTLNEAINGINDFDKVLVGYIPIGSSNDFSRDLDLPKDTQEIVDRIVEGKELRALDLGRLTYNNMSDTFSRLHDENISKVRIFDVSAGIGFDAAVCEEALSSGTKNFFNKLGLGKLTYGSIAIRQLMGAQKIPCDIELDDGTTHHLDHFLFIATMIHHYEGGGFNMTPTADLTDGLFDLCVIGNMSKPAMFRALPFAYFGKHYRFKGIYHYTARKLTIKTAKPLWVHTDGEVSVKSDNITLECLQQKLHLMI